MTPLLSRLMVTEKQNSVGLPLVLRVVEELHSRAGNRRVEESEIPFAFIMFVDRVCGDLSRQVLGNHFPDSILYRLPLADRIGKKPYIDTIIVDGEIQVAKTYPRVYFNLFLDVVPEWFERYQAKKKKHPQEEQVIRDIFGVLGDYVNNGAGE